MKEQFVTYEIASKLKELGFDDECFGYYSNKTSHHLYLECNYKEVTDKINNPYTDIIKAPLWQQAIDWFRKKYNIEINISDNTLEKKYVFVINKSFSNTLLYSSGKWMAQKSTDTYYITFEEARKQSILIAIDLITNK